MPKRSNLKPPGQCIFCGGGGMSKAHIWPEWLIPFNPATSDHSVVTTGKFDTFTTEVPGPDFSESYRQGPSGSRKLRIVCRRCNAGWMSRIEEDAKPAILRLMNDRPDYVSQREQRLLATWLCLVTIMVEFIDPGTQAIPKDDRDWLMDQREPPPHWLIWLARYKGAQWGDLVCRRTGLQIATAKVGEPLPPFPNVGLGKCNTQVTTMVVGQFCAHLFSSAVGYAILGYTGVELQPIWPARDYAIFWPLVTELSDAEIVSMSEAVPRSGVPFPRSK